MPPHQRPDAKLPSASSKHASSLTLNFKDASPSINGERKICYRLHSQSRCHMLCMVLRGCGHVVVLCRNWLIYGKYGELRLMGAGASFSLRRSLNAWGSVLNLGFKHPSRSRLRWSGRGGGASSGLFGGVRERVARVYTGRPFFLPGFRFFRCFRFARRRRWGRRCSRRLSASGGLPR